MCSSFGTIGVGSTTFALAEAMHHSRDHNVIIVGPPPVPVEEQILIKNFKEYMTEMWVINRFYEGETIPRLLIKIGLSTWYKLEAEYLLIKNKQSKHNRHTRTCIEKAYNIIVKKV